MAQKRVDDWKTLYKAFTNAIKGEWTPREVASLTSEVVKKMTVLSKEVDDLEVACRTAILKQDALGAAKQLDTHSKKVRKFGKRAQEVRGLLGGVDKAAKPKTYRGLKVLATGIDSMQSSSDFVHKTLIDGIAAIGKEREPGAAVKSTHQKALPQLKKGILKAVACAQRVKANPTPEGWATAINQGMGRDCLMAMRTLRDAKKAGSFEEVPPPNKLMALFAPYDTEGRLKRLAEDADRDAVLAELKSFTKRVKSLKSTYERFW